MEVKREPKILIKVEPDPGRIVTLSPVDLVSSNVHVKTLVAFEAPVPDDACSLLAEGLRETLRAHEELAGRFCEDSNGRLAIELNGAGCGWIKAEANVALRDWMPFDPTPELMELAPPHVGVEELLLVQVTAFKCGGIAVCTAMHHRVVDGMSACAFTLARATSVRRKFTGFHDARAPPPSVLHDRSALIPANPASPRFEHLEYKETPPGTIGADDFPRTVKLKLHFEPKQLEVLKAEAMKDMEDGSIFSTFQCLTAHIWRCISRARGLSGETVSKVLMSVNGGKVLDKRLPDNYFGNCYFLVYAESYVKDLVGKPLCYAAIKLRQAIRRVDTEYILSVLDLIELQQRSPRPEPVLNSFGPRWSPHVCVTSWQQLQFYNTDFGWGTPFYFGSIPPDGGVEGMLVVLPSYTKDGGIDVFVGVQVSDAEKFKEYAFDLSCSRG